MYIRYATLVINALLMIAMPIAIGIFLKKRFLLSWRYFWIGGATFVLSQVVHIPVNLLISPAFDSFDFISLHPTVQLVFQACFLGLSAGVFEELSRYVMYRYWVKSARKWSYGLFLGAGHGGIESMIFGVLALISAVQVIVYTQLDLSRIVSPDQVALVESQLNTILTMPIYLTLLGAIERLFALCIHIACSLLVLRVFTHRNYVWLAVAVLFHAFVDGAAVFMLGLGLSETVIEGVMALFALCSLICIIIIGRDYQQSDGQKTTPTDKDELHA